MTAHSQARAARLGPEAVAAAEQLAATAPPPSPALRRAIEAVLRMRELPDGGEAAGPTERAS